MVAKIIEMKIRRIEHEFVHMVVCEGCQNKTFTIQPQEDSDDVLVLCAACGMERGTINWEKW